MSTKKKTIHLTPQETKIARLFLKGLDNKQLAAETGLAYGTVGTVTHNLRKKFDIPTSSPVALALALHAFLKPTQP